MEKENRPDTGTAKAKKLDFKFVPGFAGFILEHKLKEFASLNMRLAFELDFPMLKYYDFDRYSEAELVELALPAYMEFLTYAKENRLDEQIRESINRWTGNQLPNITRDQLVLEDLTLSTHLRKNGLYKFIPVYTGNIELAMQLVKEIDAYGHEAQSLVFAAYIDLQHEKISGINAELHSYKEKLLEGQEIAQLGSFEWDLTGGDTSSYTPQVYRIFGMEKTTSLTDFYNYVHPGDQEKLKSALENAIREGKLYECEYRYVRNGGEKVIWSRGVVKYKDGRAVRLTGTLMDITDRHYMLQRIKEREENLEQLNNSLELKNKELKRSNEELMSFSYAASHDLQEPLRKIKTFSGFLLAKETDKLSDDGKTLLEKIDGAVAKMQKLIMDLLAFSRTETSHAPMAPVDLTIVIAGIAQSYKELQPAGVGIEFGQLPVISGVPFQVQQLFENIVSNSVKYAKKNSPAQIRITSGTVPGHTLPNAGRHITYIRISVADNGIGFEQQYAERIFEIFQRLHGKSEYSGTGIGLAICKRIMQNHNGFIMATGKPGEGAVFDVYFPVV